VLSASLRVAPGEMSPARSAGMPFRVVSRSATGGVGTTSSPDELRWFRIGLNADRALDVAKAQVE
jgi:hypothetical protein